MKKSRDLDIRRKLSGKEFGFVVVVTVLFSFLTITILLENFASELGLSPFVMGSNSYAVSRVVPGLQDTTSVPTITSPTNLAASIGEEQIKLRWDTPTPGTEPPFYEIYRSATQTGPFEKIGETVKDETIYYDTEPVLAQTWYYKILAAGNPAFSNTDQGRVSQTKGKKWMYDSKLNGDHYGFVSIGDSGTKVFASQIGGYGIKTSIFTTSDSHPPTPLNSYDSSTAGGTNWGIHLIGNSDAARYTDKFINTRIGKIVGADQYNGALHQHTPITNPYSFEYIHTYNQSLPSEYAASAISGDGSTIVSVMPESLTTSKIAMFNSAGTITHETIANFALGTQSTPGGFDFSEDLTRLVIGRGGKRIQIYDTFTGSMLFQSGFISLGSVLDVSDVALDHAGGRAAVAYYGESPIIKLFVDPFNANEYELTLPVSHNHVPGQFEFVRGKLALSDDGTKLAYAYADVPWSPKNRTGIVLWDITDPQNPVVLVDYKIENNDFMGYEAYTQQQISNVEITPDGNRFVVSAWGDGTPYVPHLMVFETGINEPIAEFRTLTANCGGSIPPRRTYASILDSDISPDGTYVSMAAKETHEFGCFGTTKEINTYYVA